MNRTSDAEWETPSAPADVPAPPKLAEPVSVVFGPPETPSTPPLEPSRSPEPHSSMRQMVATIVVATLAGVGGILLGAWIERRDDLPEARPSSQPVVVAADRQQPLPALDVAAVAAALSPSVVAIQATSGEGDEFDGATGTGVVLTADGEILTNEHVIAGAERIAVRLSGETEPRPAVVVASDPSNDLALLRIDATDLQPARFAAAGDVGVGDQVVAIGFALDLDGQASVTQGIVSATDRTLTVGDDTVLTGLVQTDAAISSGNSGGPLVNAAGEVVGINTLVAETEIDGSAANGLAFAISNSVVLPAIEGLRAGEQPADGFLGVQLTERIDGGSGALVAEVVPDSPADDAGVRVGDVVVSVDDVPIDGQAALVAVIRRSGSGATVSIEVVRDGEVIVVDATLVERPRE